MKHLAMRLTLIMLCILPLTGLLGACATNTPDTASETTVQDLNPGDRSMIQPPATQKAPAGTIKEKSI